MASDKSLGHVDFDDSSSDSSYESYDTGDSDCPDTKETLAKAKGKHHRIEELSTEGLETGSFDNLSSESLGEGFIPGDDSEIGGTSTDPTGSSAVDRAETQKKKWLQEAQMKMGDSDSDVGSVISVDSSLDAEYFIDNLNVKPIPEENLRDEGFEDVKVALEVDKLRDEFQGYTEVMLHLLEILNLGGMDESINESRMINAMLRERSRKIAALFGDDILSLNTEIKSLKEDVANEKALVQSYRYKLSVSMLDQKAMEQKAKESLSKLEDAEKKYKQAKDIFEELEVSCKEQIVALKLQCDQSLQDSKTETKAAQAKLDKANLHKGETIRIENFHAPEISKKDQEIQTLKELFRDLECDLSKLIQEEHDMVSARTRNPQQQIERDVTKTNLYEKLKVCKERNMEPVDEIQRHDALRRNITHLFDEVRFCREENLKLRNDVSYQVAALHEAIAKFESDISDMNDRAMNTVKGKRAVSTENFRSKIPRPTSSSSNYKASLD
jgi:hypothetical protein